MLGAGGGLLAIPLSANAAPEPPTATSSPAALRAYERRVGAATADRAAFRESTDNGDAERYAAAGAIVTYAKGFKRSPNGRVDSDAYSSYARAIARRDATLLDPNIQGINRGLLEYALEDECVIAGCDPRGIALAPAPRIASSEQAREAVELAWLALVRDVPFAAYDSDRLVAAAARDLGYVPQTLLRPRNLAMTGPIISQLALRDIPMDPFDGLSQRLPCYTAGIDFLIKRDEWLIVQSGGRTGKQNTHDARRRYLSNARDLAGWVSENEPFANAAAIIDDLPDEAHARSWLPQAQSGLLGIGSICAGVGTMKSKARRPTPPATRGAFRIRRGSRPCRPSRSSAHRVARHRPLGKNVRITPSSPSVRGRRPIVGGLSGRPRRWCGHRSDDAQSERPRRVRAGGSCRAELRRLSLTSVRWGAANSRRRDRQTRLQLRIRASRSGRSLSK
jgi:hypothetical protein